MSRIHALPVVAGFAALAAGCGGGGGAPSADASQARTFVGASADGRTAVAVAVDEPLGPDNQRRVAVFACDGRQLAQWLRGDAAGDRVSLRSDTGDGGATVLIAAEAARGTVTTPGGRRIAFTAAPVTGAAGLYTVSVSADGRLEGESREGLELQGRIGDVVSPGVARLEGSFTVAPGARVQLASFAYLPLRPGVYRWAVTANGRATGARRGSDTASVDPDPKAPTPRAGK